MGNRKNANKKRNLSKIKNKTSDNDKTLTETVDLDEKRDIVDVVDAEKSGEKCSDQVNNGDKSVVEISKAIETTSSLESNTKTDGDAEGGEQTQTLNKENTFTNTENTLNSTNFGISSCPKCTDIIPGGGG